MKWFKIISQDYMDMDPYTHYKMFESEDDALKYVKHMQEHWHSGTTDFGGAATMDEILEYCERYDIPLTEDLKKDIMNPDNYIN